MVFPQVRLMKELVIEVKEEKKLLDILGESLKDLSNKKLKSYIKYEMVEVDGQVTTNSSKVVKEGSIVKIYFSKKVIPEYDLHIVYEDDDLIAINKPAGLLSISNSKEKDVTAFRQVSDYIKKSDKKARLFVVHRIDQGTSGVLLFAKNLKLKEKLQKNWGEYVKKREYIAVVEGIVKEAGMRESYLTMNHFQIVHSTKNEEIGNYAITHYKPLKVGKKRTMLEVLIDTGRRNQIRVHMSEMGNPIIGDKKYGSCENPINRLALHASKLHIVDPRNGKLLKLESEVPKEFYDLVK